MSAEAVITLPELEKYLQLIRLLYSMDSLIVRDDSDLQAFAQKNRFHPRQHLFSADSLKVLLQESDPLRVTYVTDALRIRIAVLFIGSYSVLLGPFTSVVFSHRDIVALSQQFPGETMDEGALQHYVNSFPYLMEATLTHILTALLHVLVPDEPAREITDIRYQETQEPESEEKMVGERPDRVKLLETRYAHEEAYINAVVSGNTRKALQEMHNMQMDVAYLKRVGTTLENERVGAAILRTTTRLAAKQAGLPSLLLDKISSENTLAAMRAATTDEIIAAQETMIREFCQAIYALHTEKHSAVVQSALYSIKKDYIRDITVQSIASELDISVNRLITVFKKEMHVTPNVYLRNYRLSQAARMLVATDLPVQDIASIVGIPDSSYMIRQFRAFYGETPLAYRKRHRV